jgi:RNA polymerase sigma-70 factor (ECF subfamily)
MPLDNVSAIEGDGELLRRMREGDSGAFAAVMRHNNQRLYRLARGILRDADDAEEAVQEGYLRAFTHLDGFKGEASLATWLARVVTNEALGTLRRRRPTVEIDAVADKLSADSPVPMPDTAAVNPERAAARQEIRRAIEAAVDALPAPFRAVFVLRAIEQLSTRDTALALGIPEETVKTRFHRANRLLREELSEHFAAIWDDAFPFAGARCDRIVTAVLARLMAPGAPPAAAGSA